MLLPRHLLLLSFLALSYFGSQLHAVTRLPQDEVDVLNQIAKTMGANWTFGSDACEDYNDIKQIVLTDPIRTIDCDCQIDNSICHVKAIRFMRFSLNGTLPAELVRLPYISEIDFAYNCLRGSIPLEWASIQLKYISVFVNQLSGKIPSYLGNMTSLTYLDLETNQFSGTVPPEIGKLVNLETLKLSSNRLTGNLPLELAALKNLTDFRINDNNFDGMIPDFISSWKGLKRLEMEGTGLKGPIPQSLSLLENLTQIRISDIRGTNQYFPMVKNMPGLTRILLKNCSISGAIPEYIWGMPNLRYLDLSFNHLSGEITNVALSSSFKFIFLTNNFLSGNIPQSILKKGINVDLSYNNFSVQSVEFACQQKLNLNLNLFRSSSEKKNMSGVLSCSNKFSCRKYEDSFYINCGGGTVKEEGKTYEGDEGIGGGAATFHLFDGTNWGFSSTGDFADDDDEQNTHYIVDSQSSNIPQLYTNARIVPTSLTYVGYCLENGGYNVNLHFAEIKFTNDTTYKSLGRRVFDIYVQDKLVEKDFDIEARAGGVLKPLTIPYTTNISNNILEIRLTWAGKGTTAVPEGGVYGPLISAISVESKSKSHDGEGNRKAVVIGVSAAVAIVGLCLSILIIGILYRRHCMRTEHRRDKEFADLDLQTTTFTLRKLKDATNNFDSQNKIGEGGFGPVYKGFLSDGTIIAVKQLSSKSRQGNREFLNEIGMISCLQHPNLVKIYGCCIEKDQLLLVYEYMENNSLARALFGHGQSQIKLDWPTRYRICLGVAKGLAYLHEESRFKIVHRDIKPTNVLLDRDLNPKISDFGLAKLDEEEKTHISTRIAGTVGYMAPEYALWGYLTYKADVYSFGIVALEIVSGKNNMSYVPADNCYCVLDWAFHLYHTEKLLELVDQTLAYEFNEVEAERMIKVALLCANASPSLRPTMSEVVNMLEGRTPLPDTIPEAGSHSEDMKFKALKEKRNLMQNHFQPVSSSSSSSDPSPAHEVPEVNAEKYLKFKNLRDSRLQFERQNSMPPNLTSATTSERHNSMAQSSTSATTSPLTSSLETAHDLHTF